MSQQGRVENVYLRDTGSTLEEDYAAGVTIIDVANAGDFQPDGGDDIEIDGKEYYVLSINYGGEDGVPDQLVLESATTAAHDAGTSVRILPFSQLLMATVAVENNDDDGIECVVPSGMWEMLAEGVRGDESQQESVDVDVRNNRWEIITVEGEQPTYQVEYLSEEVGGGQVGPVEPPASSPGVSVTGFPDALGLQLDGTIEPGARVQYHLSEDQVAGVNFAPTTATAVGSETTAGVLIVDSELYGKPILEGVDYYARVVAINDLGSAPAGMGGSGRLNLAAIKELFLAVLRTGYLLTGRIDIGLASISADEGIKIPNPPEVQPDGSLVQRFSYIPFNGDPIRLLGDIVATNFTAQGVATFLQELRIVRRVLLQDGISAPREAPVVASAWPTVNLSAGNAAVGLAMDPNSSARYLTTRALTLDGVSGLEVVSIVRSTGTASTRRAFTPLAEECAGLVVAGDRYWILGKKKTESIWSLIGISTTNASDVVVRRLSYFAFDGTELPNPNFQFRPALGVSSTGGSLWLAWGRRGSGSGYEIAIRTYTASNASYGSEYVIQQSINDSQRDISWIGQGNFNFGASRIVAIFPESLAQVWSGTLTDATRMPEFAFPKPAGGSAAGACWDGSRFATILAGSPNQIAVGSASRTGSESVTVAGSSAGKTSGGSNVETNIGPSRTATIAAQAQIGITAPTPPEADRPDPVTASDPVVANRAAVYALISGVFRQQAILAIGARAVNFDTFPQTLGKQPGAVGAFTSSPGDIAPERGSNEADKYWIGKGSGYFRLRDLEIKADGTVSVGLLMAAAIAAAVNSDQKGKITTADVTGTSPFTSNAVVTKIGNLVFFSGSFSRASSFSTAFTQCGTIPAGYRPGGTQTLPAAVWFNTTDSHSIAVAASGVVNCRMSAARNAVMGVSAVWVAEN